MNTSLARFLKHYPKQTISELCNIKNVNCSKAKLAVKLPLNGVKTALNQSSQCFQFPLGVPINDKHFLGGRSIPPQMHSSHCIVVIKPKSAFRHLIFLKFYL